MLPVKHSALRILHSAFRPNPSAPSGGSSSCAGTTPQFVHLNAVQSLCPFPLRFILLTFLSSFILHPSSFADTTFVSGAVSGEWTRDGNPWIVEDSTWVPEGERLTLREGVEVFFEENVGLWIEGMIGVEGLEEDSVRFKSLNDSVAWRGIIISGRSEQHRFDYAAYTDAPKGISLADGIRIYIGHSVITGESKAVGGPEEGGFSDGGICVIEHSVLLGEYAIDKLLGTRITIDNSIVHRRIAISGGTINAHGCTFFDGIEVDYANYFDCRFLRSGLVEYPRVKLGGTMENCYSEILIRVEGVDSRISHLECLSTVMGHSASLVIDSSVVMKNLYVDNTRDDESIIVRNCTIWDQMLLRSYRTEVFRCVVYGRTDVYSGGGSILIDSSEFRGKYHNGEEEIEHFAVSSSSRLPGTVRLTRSLVTMPVTTTYMDSTMFENNTFYIYDAYGAHGFYIDNDDRNVIVRNNTFVAAEDSLKLFDGNWARNRPPFIFQYNLIYGFAGLFGLERYAFEIDSTNFEADPRFVSPDSSDFHLLADSPCIDAGYPGSRDPDGTRGDIGAYFYPQWQSVSNEFPEFSSSFDLISFYPNPSNSGVTFHNPTPVIIHFQIIDIFGRTVVDPVRIAPFAIKSLDLNSLGAGLYFVSGAVNGRTVHSKLIIQK